MKLQSPITLLAKIMTIVAVLMASQLSPALAVEQSRDVIAAKVSSPMSQATPEPILFGEFDTATNGFGFQNYGRNFPEGNLTIAEVQEMFGDQVCQRLDGKTCIPSADAQLWLDTMNQHMEGGHCNGFTVMSNRLFEDQFAPEEFSEQAETAFHIEQTAPIMRRIAQNWTQQVTDEILYAEFWGTPQEVVDALQVTTELVEVKIYFGNLGHSMLGYGLQDMGDGNYRILVYDNNWPGRTDLYVEVDYDADSWRYSLAALNPDEASDVWNGDGRSAYPSLVFVPLSAYDQELTCPFCSSSGSETAATTNVGLTGAGDFLVRDDQGRYSGIWAGAVIDDIPDSQVQRFVGGPSTKAAQVNLPAEEDVTVQVGNTTLSQAEPGDLRIGSPGFSVAVDDLMLPQSCSEEVAFSHNTQTVRYAANSVQDPVFKLAVQSEEGADFLFVVAGAEFQPGQDLSLGIDPNNGLVLTSDTLDADNVTLVMARLGATGESIFATEGLAIQSGGAIALDYANWNRLAPLTVQIDADGDGVFELTAALNNTFPQTPVAGATSGDELITLLNEVAPYMDQTEKSAFIEAVGAGPLEGDDIGRLFLALDELEISDDDLAVFFAIADLPLEEAAEVIHEVRRDVDSQTALLDRLPLSADDKAVVQGELQSLDEVQKVLVDLDFLDPAPHEQVSALLPFILDRGLNPGQIGNLMERLVAQNILTDTETEDLLKELNLSPEMDAEIRGDLSATSVDDTPAEPTAASEADATAAEPTSAPDAEPTPTVEEPPTPSPMPTVTPAPTLAQTPTPVPTTVATSATTQAPATAAGQLSLEAFGSWRRGDQPYGTFIQSNDCVQEGSFAGKLAYDFSAATAADDFVVFTQRIAIPGNSNTIQAWVHGDGSGHLFNIWIEDANGEVWSVPMGSVTHTGWQQMTGVIAPNAPWPGGRVYGPENGAIDYPIRFQSIVVDRTDGPATGTLCFDNFAFSMGDVPAPTSAQDTTASDDAGESAPTSNDAAGQASDPANVPAPIAQDYSNYIFSWSWNGYPMMSAAADWYFDVKIFDNEFSEYPYDVKVAEVDAVRLDGDQWYYDKRSDFKCGSFWSVQIAARNPDGSYAGPMSTESNRVPTGADCPPEAPSFSGDDGGDDGGDDDDGDSCGGDDCFEGS